MSARDSLTVVGTFVAALSAIGWLMLPVTKHLNRNGLTATTGQMQRGEDSAALQSRLMKADERQIGRLRRLQPYLALGSWSVSR
ncbi:hypothetical protein [Jatrophihabitans sp.]|uniref:hypothetical protein n=1 Tax=Jatrophihabitans sp. TaxID=1932789 RepID=UPI003F80E2C7